MALLASKLERVFHYEHKGKKLQLADPDPSWTVEAVMNFYSNTYPELTTAKSSEPKINKDKIDYTFSLVVGTKG